MQQINSCVAVNGGTILTLFVKDVTVEEMSFKNGLILLNGVKTFYTYDEEVQETPFKPFGVIFQKSDGSRYVRIYRHFPWKADFDHFDNNNYITVGFKNHYGHEVVSIFEYIE